MDQEQMESWVARNCKFAKRSYNRKEAQMMPQPMRPMQPQPMPNQPKLLPPQEVEQIVAQIIKQMQGAAQQDPDPNANYNAVSKQVTMALQSAVGQRGGALQNLNGAVEEVMKGLGLQRPLQAGPQQQPQQGVKPMTQGPAGWEPPGMSALRNRPKI